MTLLENRQKIDDFRDGFNRLKEQLDRGVITNTALVIARVSRKIDMICMHKLYIHKYLQLTRVKS